MRWPIPAAILLILPLSSCDTAPATGPGLHPVSFKQTVAARQAVPQRPISGRCELTTVETQPISPTVVRRVSIGECQLAHLGRAQLLSVARTNLVTLDQQAEHTFTAANGDLLLAESAGGGTLVPPVTVTFEGVTTLTGGTGRFAGAIGVMKAAGTSNLAEGVTWLTYEGWITY